MSQKSKAVAKTSAKAAVSTLDRKQQKIYPITQRGIKTTADLAEFFSAIISDIAAGRADLKEAAQMSSFAGKLISLSSLQLRLGLARKGVGSHPLLIG